MTLNDLFRVTLDDPFTWQMEKSLLGLSKWWLRPEYYEAMGIVFDRPPLPTVLGFCPILLQVKEWNENRICRRGLILPLRWTEKTSPKEEQRSKKLPKELLELARKVQTRLREEGAEKEADDDRKRRWDRLDQWELIPAIKSFPDLSSLSDETFSWDSATIPLAASLLLTAVDEEAPKPDVFGSGAWNFGESYMDLIAGVREKRDVVTDWGGSILFLPEDRFFDVPLDELRAESNKSGGPKIITLSSVRRTLLREAVDPYRRTLRREPEENDPKKCACYYQEMPNDQAALQDFYRRRLADAVAAQCRKRVEERYSGLIPCLENGTLVTWISTGTELVNVAAKCFHLQKITLLYTPSMEERMRNCRESLPEQVEVTPVRYDGALRFDDLTEFLKEQFARLKGEMITAQTVLVDLTLGTVVMSLALQEAAPEKAALLYWYKDQGKNNRIEPLSTEPEIRIKRAERKNNDGCLLSLL